MPVCWFVSQRAAGVLRLVLPQSSEALQHALQQNFVPLMHQLLKVRGHNSILIDSLFLRCNCLILALLNRLSIFAIRVWAHHVVISRPSTQRDEPMTTKYAIQTLATCTAASRLAREDLLQSDKSKGWLACQHNFTNFPCLWIFEPLTKNANRVFTGFTQQMGERLKWVLCDFPLIILNLYCRPELSDLRHLLGSSCDEMVLGNAALCCAHCLELEGIASNLLGTDIVPVLLRHAAADTANPDVQKNAAIALGKLCRSEPRCFTPLIPSRKDRPHEMSQWCSIGCAWLPLKHVINFDALLLIWPYFHEHICTYNIHIKYKTVFQLCPTCWAIVVLCYFNVSQAHEQAPRDARLGDPALLYEARHKQPRSTHDQEQRVGPCQHLICC